MWRNYTYSNACKSYGTGSVGESRSHHELVSQENGNHFITSAPAPLITLTRHTQHLHHSHITPSTYTTHTLTHHTQHLHHSHSHIMHTPTPAPLTVTSHTQHIYTCVVHNTLKQNIMHLHHLPPQHLKPGTVVP